MPKSGCYLFILLLSAGCYQLDDEKSEPDLPEYIQQLDNLTIIQADETPPDSVDLIREVVFESNDDVIIEGFINSIDVDEEDRLYIAATAPGKAGIYLYEPDGSFITSFAREGRGPGEYESISSLDISGDKIYLFDPRLQKTGIFSVHDFSHIGDVILNRDLISREDSLASMLRGNELVVPNDSEKLLKLQGYSMSKESDIPVVAYNRVTNEGVIQPEPLIRVDRFPFYFPVETERPELPFAMPFSRSSLVSVSGDGRFYTNWTEDFLIKIYDNEGTYEEAFYFPMKKSSLNMRDFEVSRDRQRTLNQYVMPETWPVVNTMELDDEERLWVSTITESDSVFQWYVLDQQGKMIARFQKPGNRTSRSVMSKPMYLIKKGYFYSLERNFNQGIERVVKHRIVFRGKDG